MTKGIFKYDRLKAKMRLHLVRDLQMLRLEITEITAETEKICDLQTNAPAETHLIF